MHEARERAGRRAPAGPQLTGKRIVIDPGRTVVQVSARHDSSSWRTAYP
ncbi:hypothetical protein [Nocardia wallacei]|nr:hypothetical protein [Nocardia wallacei]